MAYRFRYLPFVLFIASGAFALVYEVTWSRYLGLFIGNTNLANMCVLASFMGGLALGSVLIGARTVRFARPLAVYGWLEAVIGLYAVLFPIFIKPVQSVTLDALSAAPPGSSIWVMAKLAVSVLVLLLPTVLMGGTFPVLMKHFQPEPGGEDKAEWLYLANCVGAVGGALAAGFMLIPEYGLWGTLIGIGGANLALGLIAVVIAFIEPAAVTYPAEAAPSLGQPQKMRSLKKLIYIAIAASGITAMVYELSWFRLFALTLGSSTYSFTLMVSAFITGIALGSMIVGFSPGMRARPLLSFAIAEIGIALIAVLSIPVYVTLPYLFWKWSALLTPSLDSLWLYNLGKYGLCFLVMVVPTVFFGMTLPLAIKAVARRDEQIGRDSGYVYGANTAGNIAGALLAGFILIPLVGLRHSLEMALAANVLIGAALLWGTPLRLKRPAGGFICAVVFVLIFAMPRWHPAAFTSGIFRLRGDAPANWKQYRQRLYDRKVLYYKEDGNGITAVLDIDDGSPQLERTLLVNGKADASAPGDMPTQALSAHIPMFLMPNARDALVIGLGSGVTAGCVLIAPRL
jgi:predicted membrane-bound spermidine synthase